MNGDLKIYPKSGCPSRSATGVDVYRSAAAEIAFDRSNRMGSAQNGAKIRAVVVSVIRAVGILGPGPNLALASLETPRRRESE